MAYNNKKPVKLENSQIMKYLEMVNIAEAVKAEPDGVGDRLLQKMGTRVCGDLDIDENSRTEWRKKYDKAMKLARFMTDKKSFPWENAANVIFPLIAQTAVQFNSRVYPNIVQNGNIVKGKVIGKDEDGKKAEQANRVGTHMSYQLSEEMDDWEEGMDNLLMHLPLVGTAFKKTWYDPYEKKNVSKFYPAEDIVINMNTKSFKKVRRITHVFEMHKNVIEENIRLGAFLRFEYGTPQTRTEETSGEKTSDVEGWQSDDLDAPHIFYEQHRYWDLDEDGYEEPYIVTVHRDTKIVVRIVARYDHESLLMNEKGQLAKINPIEYFTRYIFLPDVSGKMYGMGWGILLGHANETINSAINQLLDAATDQNAGGGFIDQRIALKKHNQGGSMSFALGEWKLVSVKGDDLRKNIVPRPTSAPSTVLMSLITFMTESTEKFTSTVEVLSGKQTLANVPATTTMALIEQSLKVITAITKRIHRSMKQELKKLFRLNKKFLDEEVYFNILDTPQAIKREDYNDASCDVVPVSDPNNITDSQRLLKAEAMLGMRGQEGLIDKEINRFYVESIQVGDMDRFFIPKDEEQQPSAEAQQAMMEYELEQKKVAVQEREVTLKEAKDKREAEKLEAEIEKIKQETVRLHSDSVRLIAEAESKEAGEQIDEYKDQVARSRKVIDRLKIIVKGLRDGNDGGVGGMAGTPDNATVPKGSTKTKG